MDAIKCITTRRSIRAFKQEPIDSDLLRKVVDIARWSPSYKDSQPWEVIILSGERKKALSQMMVDLLERGAEPTPDLPAPVSWPEKEQERIDHLYAARKEATGIDLNDPGIIQKAKKANFNFYNAPHAFYLLQDSSLSQWSLFDLGLFAQSLMLAAHALGLGTVPQAFATDYADDVKKFLDIPQTKRLVLGISIGYPDMDSPVNGLRSDRVAVDEVVRWIE